MKATCLRLFPALIFTILLFLIVAPAALADTSDAGYAFGEDFLEWDGAVYLSDGERTYQITEVGEEWNTIYYGSGTDFFAVGDMVYFLKQGTESNSSSFIVAYDIEADDTDLVRSVRDGSSLVGVDGNNIYYLERDYSAEDYEGYTLRTCDLDGKNVEDIAGGVGEAVYWNGILVISGMATDISPVELVMIDTTGEVGLVDENAGKLFYAGDEGFYYFSYDLQDDYTWDSVSVCTIDSDGRRTLATFEGDTIYLSLVGVTDGYLYCSYYISGESVLVGIDVETGDVYETDRPDEGYIPSLYVVDNQNYWYSDYTVYYWRGAGYESLNTLPTDALLKGIDSNGYCYYLRDGALFAVTLG